MLWLGNLAASPVVDAGVTVVGRGADFLTAIERAYAAAARITFTGKQVRSDIGRKAL